MDFSIFLGAVLGSSIAGFLLVYFLCERSINRRYNLKALKIADAIKSGAMTFLTEEYKVIALVVLPIVLALTYVSGIQTAGCFVLGALFSLLCGFMGMNAATDANVRTTMAAKNSGENAAFHVAFLGGG